MRILFLLVTSSMLLACATGKNPSDPYESFNRNMYSFNRTLDKAVVQPVAKGYQAITPDPVEKGISNVFANIGDVGNMLNNVFQFKLSDAVSDLGRLVVNSTLGIAGLFDPASAMGLEKHDEDFGQTLASWGIGSGPYLMLPFLGPSTIRDSVALPADNYLDPISKIEHDPSRYAISISRLIDKRVSLLSLEEQLENALDEYSFVRDAYLQNRRYKVYDGDLPLEDVFECDPEYDDC